MQRFEPSKRSLPRARRNRRERGAALIVSMLMLVMMAFIGIAALETVSVDQVVSGYQSRTRTALYAAEAGVAEGLANLDQNGIPSVAPTVLGDGGTHPHGQPSYDIAPGTAPQLVGIRPVQGMNLAIGQGGTTKYAFEFWRFTVQGTEGGGSSKQIEVAAGNFTGS